MCSLTDEERRALIAILQDHKECVLKPDFPVCGRAAVELMKQLGRGFEKEEQEALLEMEINCRAPLLIEIDEFIEKLGGNNG